MAARTAEHVAMCPGSFDPPTFGHLDVIERGRRIFDRVVVCVGRNPEKQTLFSAEERRDLLVELCGDITAREPDAAPVDVEIYEGLTVDFARGVRASALLRGIRNLSDLSYEVQQAVTNREVAGLETTFIVAGQSFAYTSSTLIKQITALGQDLSVLRSMCPPRVIERLHEKKRQRPELLERLME